ncbi:MAG: hypothetical protein V3T55_12660 [Anaerolineales bacterium]
MNETRIDPQSFKITHENGTRPGTVQEGITVGSNLSMSDTDDLAIERIGLAQNALDSQVEDCVSAAYEKVK